MTKDEITYLYEKYSRKLYNISYRILSSSFDAEEVMQDCFLKYYNRPIHFINEAKISAWLTKVCIHSSIDRLRKIKRGESLFENVSYEECNDIVDDSEPIEITFEQIVEQIQKLPDKHRVILDLVLIEGLNYRDIAEITGTKEVTLRSQFSRSRTELVKVLKNIYR